MQRPGNMESLAQYVTNNNKRQPIFTLHKKLVQTHSCRSEVRVRVCMCVHTCMQGDLCVLQQQEVFECLCTFHMIACIGLKALQPKWSSSLFPNNTSTLKAKNSTWKNKVDRRCQEIYTNKGNLQAMIEATFDWQASVASILEQI